MLCPSWCKLFSVMKISLIFFPYEIFNVNESHGEFVSDALGEPFGNEWPVES